MGLLNGKCRGSARRRFVLLSGAETPKASGMLLRACPTPNENFKNKKVEGRAFDDKNAGIMIFGGGIKSVITVRMPKETTHLQSARTREVSSTPQLVGVSLNHTQR